MREGSMLPFGQPAPPEGGLVAGIVVGGDAFLRRLVLVDPGAEILRLEVREEEHQVGQVAFGVDDDGGDLIDRGFLEEADAQARLTASRHADADGMGHEVLGVIEEIIGGDGLGFRIDGLSEIKKAELLIIGPCSTSGSVTSILRHPAIRPAEV